VRVIEEDRDIRVTALYVGNEIIIHIGHQINFILVLGEDAQYKTSFSYSQHSQIRCVRRARTETNQAHSTHVRNSELHRIPSVS
jgi:hypothetical protein